ncbi:response regulator [Stieleria marina]|uniref:histidine kinase n=1 Tax=Stieleria marina TaxID=1930275 RepID=A0A517NV01_9BACT|nr:Sensor protein ZraS [Planctomycetes bacterium K23_9]
MFRHPRPHPFSEPTPKILSALRLSVLVIVASIACQQSVKTLLAETAYQIQSANPLSEPWRISRFSEPAIRGARCVAEDHQHNMWFGLKSGLARYDGLQWRYFAGKHGLPSAPINWLTASHDGSLIASSGKGLYRSEPNAETDRAGEKWKPFFPPADQPGPEFGNVVETADGTLWVCSDWGLIRFEANQSTLYTSDDFAAVIDEFDWFDEVRSFPGSLLPVDQAYDGTGLVLVGRTVVFLDEEGPAKAAGLRIGDVIRKVNGQSNNLAESLQRSPGKLVRLSVIRPDSQAKKTISFTTTSTRKSFPSPAVHSIMRSRSGQLWCGAVNGSVLMSADEGETWSSWDKEELVVGKRPAVLEARDGKIWVISSDRDGGFDCFDGKGWMSGELSNLVGGDFVSPIVQTDDDTLWVGGLQRMHMYHNSSWKTFDTRDKELPSRGQRMFVASDDALWILGLRQFPIRIAMSKSEYWSVQNLDYQCTDAEGDRWFIDAALGLTVRQSDEETVAYSADDGCIAKPICIAALEQGVIVRGAHGQSAAVSTFDGAKWERSTFPKIARSFGSKGFKLSRDGRIWISANGRLDRGLSGGFIVGRPGKWDHMHLPSSPRFATTIVELADGRMMFAGGFGVILYDGKTWQRPDDPLLNGKGCTNACIDAEGNVWIATLECGVVKFDGTRYTQYGEKHGLPLSDIGVINVGERGGVWTNSSKGIHRFDGSHFHHVNLPNHLGRRSIRFEADGSVWLDGGKRIHADRQRPTAWIDPPTISMEQHGQWQITFQGVDTWNRTRPNELTWSYRIDDQPWSRFRRARRILLQGLRPGEHSLQLRSRDHDFNVSDVSRPTSIEVIAPVWARPWFLAAAACLLAVLAWLAAGWIRRGIALRTSNQELARTQELLASQFAVKTAQFRAICDCSPTGIFVSGVDGQLSYVNHQLERTLGVPAESALGDGWATGIHPGDRDRVVELWMKSIRTRGKFRDQGRFVHSNGDVIWFEVVAEPIKSDGGELLGFVGAVDNVTERVHSQDRLESSNEKLRHTLEQLQFTQDRAIKRERLAALGKMAAGVAHDINNSLTPILTFAELLAQDGTVVGKPHEWAEYIRTGVSDMSDTVRRLDHFYRASHNLNLLETVSLTDLIRQTVDMTKPRWQDNVTERGKRVQVKVDASSSPSVHAVASQIRAVMTNLIFNAVDAINGEGTVTIRIFEQSGDAVVEVADDGVGMTPEDLEKCLEPFYTSKDKGSGLGLSECLAIISQHGGTLEIDSTLNQGAVAKFSLPLATDVPAEPLTRETASLVDDLLSNSSSDASSPQVLYIDDEPMVRESVTAMLNSMGTVVLTAPDGMTGLEMLGENDFQLVLCDRGMPGMDGVEVMQEIKRRNPKLPVIMISGWAQPVSEGIDASEFLKKPVAYEDLQAIVRKHLRVVPTK